MSRLLRIRVLQAHGGKARSGRSTFVPRTILARNIAGTAPLPPLKAHRSTAGEPLSYGGSGRRQGDPNDEEIGKRAHHVAPRICGSCFQGAWDTERPVLQARQQYQARAREAKQVRYPFAQRTLSAALARGTSQWEITSRIQGPFVLVADGLIVLGFNCCFSRGQRHWSRCRAWSRASCVSGHVVKQIRPAVFPFPRSFPSALLTQANPRPLFPLLVKRAQEPNKEVALKYHSALSKVTN